MTDPTRPEGGAAGDGASAAEGSPQGPATGQVPEQPAPPEQAAPEQAAPAPEQPAPAEPAAGQPAPAAPEQQWPAPPTGMMPVPYDPQGAEQFPPPAPQPPAPAAPYLPPNSTAPVVDSPTAAYPTEQLGAASASGAYAPQNEYPQQPGYAAQPGYPEPGYEQAQQPYPGAQPYPPAQPQYAPADSQGYPPVVPPGTQQPYAEQQPPKKKRTGLLVGVIGGGALLLILIIAGVITFATMSASHAPQATVSSFLDQLKSGNASKALSIAGITPSSDDVLLTDKAYSQAKDKITGYTVVRTTTSGSAAVVDVQVKQPTGSFPQQFQLKQDGTDLLFFPKWKMQSLTLGQAEVQVGAPASAQVTVAGVQVKPQKNEVSLRAFPGQYQASLTSSQYFTAPNSVAEVDGFGQAPSKPAALVATLTAAGSKAANDAVTSYVNSCVASTSPTPSGCPIGLANADDFANYSNVKWTLVAAPQFTVGAKWTSTGWNVSTTVQGSVNFSANATDADGSNPGVVGLDSPEPFSVGGTITDFTSSGAKYVPSLLDLLNNL